jgi:hypothetical protein
MTKTKFLLTISYALVLGGFGSAFFGLESANSETLQSVEITREINSQSAIGCGCSQMPVTSLNEDQFFKLKAQWVNDDRIGDLAIRRFGCDCSNCRIAIATQTNFPNRQPF